MFEPIEPGDKYSRTVPGQSPEELRVLWLAKVLVGAVGAALMFLFALLV